MVIRLFIPSFVVEPDFFNYYRSKCTDQCDQYGFCDHGKDLLHDQLLSLLGGLEVIPLYGSYTKGGCRY